MRTEYSIFSSTEILKIRVKVTVFFCAVGYKVKKKKKNWGKRCIIIIIIIIITFMQNIYNYMPETYYISRVRNVAAIL